MKPLALAPVPAAGVRVAVHALHRHDAPGAEGGYETSERATNVAPEVEPVLMDAMRRLLGAGR